MKHFLIFALKSVCYDSYLYFSDALSKALAAAGHSVEIFSAQKEPPEAMERFAGQTFDAVFDFNSALPRLRMEEGGYFADQINAPFYNIILDHPLYHHDSLKQTLSDYHVLCLDKNHRDYVLSYYPHIASADIFSVTGEDILPQDPSYPEKQIDVLFSGTYTDYREIESSIGSAPSFLGNITKQLIELMQKNNSLTQEAALRFLTPSFEESEIIEETFPLHMQACFLCDSYLRARKREELLLFLAKKNVPLTLCGNGWRKSPLAHFSNVRIIDDISFWDTFLLFRKSKITLNLLPEFKNGTHDRIYSSILNHSLCLTDSSPLLESQLKNNRELIYYDTRNPDRLTGQIFDLLSSPKRMEEISQNGYFCAKESHSWQSRAAYLLTLI